MTKPGKHRRPAERRLPGVPGLAGIVSVVLAVSGVGAVLLPPNSGGPSPGGAAPAGRPPVGMGALGSPATTADRRPAPAPTGTREPARTPGPAGTPVPTGTPGPAGIPNPTKTAKPARTATPDPLPTAQASSGGGNGTAAAGPQARVVALVNAERTRAGCPAVTANAKLTAAAQAHSQDQADQDTMSHTGSDGSTPWDRARRAGYDQAIGENVAAGYHSPQAVMDGWMSSAGHRANILNCAARAIGVGRAASSEGTLYWTQMFGSV